MSYHLQLNETVPDGIKRVVCEEIEASAAQLDSKDIEKRDEAIHEARKSVKKIRAVLRAIRPELGAKYREENARLRDVGRKLSEFRDAGAIIETFDGLKDKYRDQLGRRTLGSIRRALISQKQKAEQGNQIETVLENTTKTLRGIGKDVESWQVHEDGFSAIAPGLQRTYRAGRKALANAKKRPSPENFHEWRKRVKDHWYHIRLLEGVWTDMMQAYERDLKDLETWLGDDHNLVVLRDKIAGEPHLHGSQKDIELLLEFIGRYEKELREKAFELGERIYQDRPRLFTKRIELLWAAWQAQGKKGLKPVGSRKVHAPVTAA
jgi:CHAD domain-containing protein